MIYNNDMHGVLLKALEQLKEKTRVNFGAFHKSHSIRILKEAQQQAHGIVLVYRASVSPNVHLDEFENQYLDFLNQTDKKIAQLEEETK